MERYKNQESFATDPILKEDEWNNLQDIMDEAEELPEKAPYDELVNNEFAEEVLDQ